MRSEAPKGDTCLFTGLVQTGNGESIPFYLPGVKEEHVKGAINYLHTKVMGGDHKGKSEFVGVAGDISFDEEAGWAKSVEEAEKIANRLLTNKVINAGDGKIFVINLPDGRKIYKKSVVTRIRKATAQEMLWQKSKKSDKRAESATPVKQQEADMSGNITKTELEALLRANKSEVDVVAANIQKEMAEWREQQNAHMSQLNVALSVLTSKIDSKFEVIDAKIDSSEKSLNAKFDGIDKSLNAKIDGINESLNGKIDGINTAIGGINTGISGIQSGITSKLTKFGVATGAAVTIIAAIAGVIISNISSSPQAPVSQVSSPLPPIIINIPPFSAQASPTLTQEEKQGQEQVSVTQTQKTQSAPANQAKKQ